MTWQSNSSSQHTGLSRFLIVLGIVAVVAVVGYAISVFTGKSGEGSGKTLPKQEKTMDAGTASENEIVKEENSSFGESENGKDPEGRTVLTGIASDVFSRKDNPELKWVTLSVLNRRDGSVTDYKFVFTADTKGDAKAVLGGETIAISFFGDPSSKDAVVAGEVKKMEKTR